MTPRVRWFVACLAVSLASPIAGTAAAAFAIRRRERRTALPEDERPSQPRKGDRPAPLPGSSAPVGLGYQKRPLPAGMGAERGAPGRKRVRPESGVALFN
jgi:hypothetical protein